MFGLEFIKKLSPCKWRYKPPLDDGLEHFGFIAQDVDALASHTKYGFVVLGENGVYGLHLTEFIGPMVQAIKELEARVVALESNSKQG